MRKVNHHTHHDRGKRSGLGQARLGVSSARSDGGRMVISSPRGAPDPIQTRYRLIHGTTINKPFKASFCRCSLTGDRNAAALDAEGHPFLHGETRVGVIVRRDNDESIVDSNPDQDEGENLRQGRERHACQRKAKAIATPSPSYRATTRPTKKREHSG